MKNKELDLKKMVFIYNAIQSGWVVKKKSNNLFEFKKKKSNMIKELILDNNQLLNFVDKNIKTDTFLKNIL
jgi:hypothetical protein